MLVRELKALRIEKSCSKKAALTVLNLGLPELK